MFALFLEHIVPIDPIIIRNHMLALQHETQALENQKWVLLNEQEEIIVRAITLVLVETRIE